MSRSRKQRKYKPGDVVRVFKCHYGSFEYLQSEKEYRVELLGFGLNSFYPKAWVGNPFAKESGTKWVFDPSDFEPFFERRRNT